MQQSSMAAAVAKLETLIEAQSANAPLAIHSPSPRKSKQRVAMNAATHGVSGQNIMFTDDEAPAYYQIGADYIAELKPVGVRETQLAQKIIDTNWRLNRVAAIENNMLNHGLLEATRHDRTPDDRLEAVVAQSDAFRLDCERANAFDKLGRYESRLVRSLLKFTEELERTQKARLARQPDTFVQAESKAWNWYNRMAELTTELAETRKRESRQAQDSLFCKNGNPQPGHATPVASPLQWRKQAQAAPAPPDPTVTHATAG